LTYLIDTNVLSQVLRDATSLPAQKLQTYPRSELAVPSVVRAELTFGVIKGGSAARLRTVGSFLAEFPSLPFDDVCVDAYARARYDLETRGQRIGALDLMIASIALAYDLVLVSHNTAEFSRIQGLRFEDWQVETARE
jgi:tRNA(fMet)-specific endonuclease VapC